MIELHTRISTKVTNSKRNDYTSERVRVERSASIHTKQVFIYYMFCPAPFLRGQYIDPDDRPSQFIDLVS